MDNARPAVSRSEAIFTRNAGFTIIEALVALGLVSFIAVGLLTFFQFIYAANKGTRQMAEARDLRTELRALMNDQNTCTYNLTNNIHGAIQTVPGATMPFSGISYVTVNPATGALQGTVPYYIQPGNHYRDVTSILVSQILLVYKAKIGNIPPLPAILLPPGPPPDPTSLHALNILVNVLRGASVAAGATPAPAPNVVGAKLISVTVPIAAVIDNTTHLIEGCYSDVLSVNESTFQSAMCQISSGGDNQWIPGATGGGSCVPKCFNGPSSTSLFSAPLTATCPNGASPFKCMSGGNVASPVSTPPRSFTGPTGAPMTLGGSAFPLYPANYGYTGPNNNTCTCSFFPNDILNPNAHLPAGTPMTANCMACCPSFNLNTGTAP